MSRGKPKPRIHDLSRTPPTREELHQVMDLITAPADPIATAVLGAALVEYELEKQIRKRFKRSDDTFWKEMTGDKGPVGTFSSQIVVGYAMRVYDEKMRDALDTVRVIRNQFAHAKRQLDFGEQLIINELHKVQLRPAIIRKHLKGDPKNVAGRYAYVSLCLDIYTRFVRMDNKSLKRGLARAKNRTIKVSPLAAALTKSLGNPQKGTPEFGQLALLGQKILNPIPLSTLPYVNALLPFLDSQNLMKTLGPSLALLAEAEKSKPK
jgi:hypothetical protein